MDAAETKLPQHQGSLDASEKQADHKEIEYQQQ